MPTASATRHPALPAAVSAALAIALYAVTLGGTYIYDDVQVIGRDTRVHSVARWKDLWTKDYFNGSIDNLYRPLVLQTYAIQWWLLGGRPWPYHLVNVLLHAGVAAAVAEFVRRLAGAGVGAVGTDYAAKAACVAGLLFAAHPVHVEAVAGIVGRAEEMCTLFILLSLILFLKRPLTRRRAAAIAACAVAAVLSKEQGMLLPFLLLALALFTRRRPESPEERQAMLLTTLGSAGPSRA